MCLFEADLEASQITRLTNLNRNTINCYLKKIRQRLVEYCDAQFSFSGEVEVEVDESFFGVRRVKGKRGRGAYGKTIVFGIFQRNGHAYTEVVPNCSKAILQRVYAAR